MASRIAGRSFPLAPFAWLVVGCSSPTPETSSETHFVVCTTDLECVAKVGAGSRCESGYCGPKGSTRSKADASAFDATGALGSLSDSGRPDVGPTSTGGPGAEGGILPTRHDAGPVAIPPCGVTGFSGFPGDGQCLAPPLAADGFQLHFGPADYTDPQAVAPYIVNAGDDVTQCVFVETPNGSDQYLDRYEAKLRPGGYAAQVAFASAATRTTPGPHACTYGNRPLLVTSAAAALGRFAGDAPELAGAALPLPAHAGLEVRVHFVNTTDQPVLAEGWFNVYYWSSSLVAKPLLPVELVSAGGTIPVGGSQLSASEPPQCVSPEARQLVLIGTESRLGLVRASVYRQAGDGGQRTTLFETYGAGDAAYLHFDSVSANPALDPSHQQAGGLSGVVTLAAGESLAWECEFQNPMPTPLPFSTQALGTGCNIHGYYLGPSNTPNPSWSCPTP